MGTTNWVTSDYPGYSTEPEQSNIPAGPLGQMTRRFDCASVGMTAAEVYQVFTVGKGMVPVHVITSVETAEGDAATLDIGDGGSTARYETDADLNSAPGVTISMDASFEYTEGDTIDIIPSITLDTAVFTVTVVYARVQT